MFADPSIRSDQGTSAVMTSTRRRSGPTSLETLEPRTLLAADVDLSDLVPIEVSDDQRPRLLVTSDLGSDPDDRQSLVRLLAYANEFEIVGLVASARLGGGDRSFTDAAGRTVADSNGNGLFEEYFRSILGDYRSVQSNLRAWDSAYPAYGNLIDLVTTGSPVPGGSGFGAGKDTDGSRAIIAAVDASSVEDPLHLVAWGGVTDLAQALWRVKTSRGAGAQAAFVSKLRVHDIAAQDNTATGWIQRNFNGLFYVLNSANGQGGPIDSGFRGMYQINSTRGNAIVDVNADGDLGGQAWIAQNIKTNALGRAYPASVNRNYRGGSDGPGMKEGDTPSFFSFMPNGLSDPADPTLGGWGGRFTETGGFTFADGAVDRIPFNGGADATAQRKYTVSRWRTDMQLDFAARMDAASGSEANHAPAAAIRTADGNDRSDSVLVFEVAAGDTARIVASGSTDRDGDRLTYQWWQYTEVSDASGAVLTRTQRPDVNVALPADAVIGTEVHVILEVTDQAAQGQSMKDYRRVILRVVEGEAPDPDDSGTGGTDDGNDDRDPGDTFGVGDGTPVNTGRGVVPRSLPGSTGSAISGSTAFVFDRAASDRLDDDQGLDDEPTGLLG